MRDGWRKMLLNLIFFSASERCPHPTISTFLVEVPSMPFGVAPAVTISIAIPGVRNVFK